MFREEDRMFSFKKRLWFKDDKTGAELYVKLYEDYADKVEWSDIVDILDLATILADNGGRNLFGTIESGKTAVRAEFGERTEEISLAGNTAEWFVLGIEDGRICRIIPESWEDKITVYLHDLSNGDLKQAWTYDKGEVERLFERVGFKLEEADTEGSLVKAWGTKKGNDNVALYVVFLPFKGKLYLIDLDFDLRELVINGEAQNFFDERIKVKGLVGSLKNFKYFGRSYKTDVLELIAEKDGELIAGNWFIYGVHEVRGWEWPLVFDREFIRKPIEDGYKAVYRDADETVALEKGKIRATVMFENLRMEYARLPRAFIEKYAGLYEINPKIAGGYSGVVFSSGYVIPYQTFHIVGKDNYDIDITVAGVNQIWMARGLIESIEKLLKDKKVSVDEGMTEDTLLVFPDNSERAVLIDFTSVVAYSYEGAPDWFGELLEKHGFMVVIDKEEDDPLVEELEERLEEMKGSGEESPDEVEEQVDGSEKQRQL